MHKFFVPAFAAAILLSAPALAQDETAEPERDASGKITDKDHPEYIRCRTESVIGSRAKKRKVCLTNRQWAEVGRDGSSLANRMVEEARAGMTTN